jgi:hypothetical protein
MTLGNVGLRYRGHTGDRGRLAPVDNLCATCRRDVDRRGSAGDFAVDNLVGAVDNGLRRVPTRWIG